MAEKRVVIGDGRLNGRWAMRVKASELSRRRGTPGSSCGAKTTLRAAQLLRTERSKRSVLTQWLNSARNLHACQRQARALHATCGARCETRFHTVQQPRNPPQPYLAGARCV